MERLLLSEYFVFPAARHMRFTAQQNLVFADLPELVAVCYWPDVAALGE